MCPSLIEHEYNIETVWATTQLRIIAWQELRTGGIEIHPCLLYSLFPLVPAAPPIIEFLPLWAFLVGISIRVEGSILKILI